MCSRTEELERIKVRLRKEREELEQRVQKGRGEVAVGSVLDRQTQATVSAGAALIRSERIQAINEALSRGISGICNDCKGEIPIGRLKANGAAERCAHCQEEYEETNPPPMPKEAFGRTTGWTHSLGRLKPKDV